MLLSEELAIDSASKDYLTIVVCGPTVSPLAAARVGTVSNVMTARYLGHSTGEQVRPTAGGGTFDVHHEFSCRSHLRMID
jgi:hypothetical protein